MQTVEDTTAKLKIVPLTEQCWTAFTDLLGKSGPSSRCWCMYWRTGPAYHKQTPVANKAAFHRLVCKECSPGLVAFVGELAVGWCQLTPREALPWLDHVKQLKRIDEIPVWSISCFYIRKGYRRRGITAALIDAAIHTAKKAGAIALEAYPIDAAHSPSSSFTGYASTFERAGFEICARRVSARPIMRIRLNDPVTGKGHH